jgi:hypothetical protein
MNVRARPDPGSAPEARAFKEVIRVNDECRMPNAQDLGTVAFGIKHSALMQALFFSGPLT